VSLDADTDLTVQLGDAGGYEATGYVSNASGTVPTDSMTTAFIVTTGCEAVNVISGVLTLTRWAVDEDIWLLTGMTNGTYHAFCSGSKTLSAELTSIRLNSQTGTANFDAGEARVFFKVR
jgi:hypothetical protein